MIGNILENITGKTVLITGASSGIGRELALQLIETGCHLILIARSEDKLQEIVKAIQNRGGKATYFSADLTNPKQLDNVISNINENVSQIDILVNNAGIGWYGYFEEMPWEVADSLIILNIYALVKLTHAILPGMKMRNSGQIINISSIIGDLPVQGAALYSSSKTFVNSFTKAFSRELTGSNVKVTLIKPGPVRTGFYNHAEEMNGRQIPGEGMAISVSEAASQIIKVMNRPKKVVYIPGYFFFMPWIDRLFSPIIDRLGPILLKKQLH